MNFTWSTSEDPLRLRKGKGDNPSPQGEGRHTGGGDQHGEDPSLRRRDTAPPRRTLSQNKTEYPYGGANKHGVTGESQDTPLLSGAGHGEDLEPEGGPYTEKYFLAN